MKITIQQEAFAGTIVQQQFEVEFVVASQQCPGMSLYQCYLKSSFDVIILTSFADCQKSFTPNTWRGLSNPSILDH